MFKIILLVILFWVIYRVIRTVTVVSHVTRNYRINREEPSTTAETQKPTKLIAEDEGEYVDFEEVKSDKPKID
ncbi:MAG: DUF4834 family protein [Bacteroidota bacterium]